MSIKWRTDEHILPGHRFFFFPEEVEPLEDTSSEDNAWKNP